VLWRRADLNAVGYLKRATKLPHSHIHRGGGGGGGGENKKSDAKKKKVKEYLLLPKQQAGRRAQARKKGVLFCRLAAIGDSDGYRVSDWLKLELHPVPK